MRMILYFGQEDDGALQRCLQPLARKFLLNYKYMRTNPRTPLVKAVMYVSFWTATVMPLSRLLTAGYAP